MGDSTSGVVVWIKDEVVPITESLTDEAVLSTAALDSMMLGMMLDGTLLVARLDSAEMGILLGT